MISNTLYGILVDMDKQMAAWCFTYKYRKTKRGKLLSQLNVGVKALLRIRNGQHELTPQGIQWVIEDIFSIFNVVRIQNTLGTAKFIQPSELQRYIDNVKQVISTLQTMHNFLDNLLF